MSRGPIMSTSSHVAESTHWYTRDGAPMYTVESKKGFQRPTTLRDARRLSLVPSVTTILRVESKPGLIEWMQRQVLMSSMTLPRLPDESDISFMNRVMRDSKEPSRAAADEGTLIHAAIQSHYEMGTPSDKYYDHVVGCVAAIRERFGYQGWIAERAFAHEMGFGGKVDLHVPANDDISGIVVDIKTKEFDDPEKITAYDDNLMQLAAYRVGLGMPLARCLNVFVSRSVPNLTKIVEWSREDLNRGWLMFAALLNFWQLKHNHT